MERQKIFSLIETQTIISETSLMVHWSFRRPQFFICWSSLLPTVVEGRKVRMQFLAGISSKSTTAKHPVWGGSPHLDREHTDSITTLGYLTLALTGSVEAAGHAMLVEGDEEANHYFIVGLGCEVVLFFDFLSSYFRMYSGVVAVWWVTETEAVCHC